MEVLLLDRISPDEWSRVAAALSRGGLACLPADTVYGLACNPGLPAAVESLYAAKGRERGKPVSLLFTDVAQIEVYLPSLPGPLLHFMRALLPGPVTVILPATADESHQLGRFVDTLLDSSGEPGSPNGYSIGARVVPPGLIDLYRHLPLPLVLTSANRSGGPEPLTVGDVPGDILQRCDFVIDGGRCPVGEPSTVVDLRPAVQGGLPRIIRQGAVSRESVEELIGECEL